MSCGCLSLHNTAQQLPNSNQTTSSACSSHANGCIVIVVCSAGLYLSLLLAIGLLAILAFNIHMALRLPTSTAVFMPRHTAPPAVTPSSVGVSIEAVPPPTQPISNNAAEALRQTDENLKKRIIALATKVRPANLMS